MMELERIEPNPDILAITRLFLEKLELLTPDERKMYSEIVEMLCRPPVVHVKLGVDMSTLDPSKLKVIPAEEAIG